MQFEPKLEPYNGSTIEWAYDDGDVFAVILRGEGFGCEILEISSMNPGQGHAKAAIRWLRETHGYVAVNDPGNEIETPEAFGFWVNVARCGLVDCMIDHDGREIFSNSRWLADNLDRRCYPELVAELALPTSKPHSR